MQALHAAAGRHRECHQSRMVRFQSLARGNEGVGVFLGSFVAPFHHGLLIISAPESTDSHDDWDPSTESVHSGPDSIYCEVNPAASGMVSVSCIEDDEIADAGLTEIFSGTL